MIFFLLSALAAAVLFVPWFWRLLYPLPYRDTVFAQAEAVNIDPYLAMAVIRVESKFRPQAQSVRGARGLMQLMPDTARWVAQQIGEEYHPDLLFDVEYNTKIGCWYLAKLLEDFGGSLPLALAAYNGGPNNVRQWLSEGIWNGEAENLHQIPFPETRDFVEKVMEGYESYRRIYGWYAKLSTKGGFWGIIPNKCF
ncbi:MAG TPA: lytic transglycosylase domain-containing protein [Clostridia bacterium]|nr:lytic transglycosylase domain-containing protein [Clostridia bacterium]